MRLNRRFAYNSNQLRSKAHEVCLVNPHARTDYGRHTRIARMLCGDTQDYKYMKALTVLAAMAREHGVKHIPAAFARLACEEAI